MMKNYRLRKKLTQPSYRRFSKDLLATAQLGISLIPNALNAASEPALKLTGDIAERVGGENVRGVTETLTHLGLAATFQDFRYWLVGFRHGCRRNSKEAIGWNIMKTKQ